MRTVCVSQVASDVRLASRVVVADSWWRRFRGLLARPPLGMGDGLLLLGCPSVHTAGMGYPIDVAFVDAGGTVVRSFPHLVPWRIGLGGPDAVHALELPAGRLHETGTVTGVRLNWS